MPIIRTPPIQGSPPPINSVALRDFTGGLNLAADDIQLPASQTADCLDVDMDFRGGFTRRWSIRSLGATGLSTSIIAKFIFHYPTLTTNGDLVVGGVDTTPHDNLAVWQTANITDGGARLALRQFTTDSTLVQTWSGFLMNRAIDASDLNLYIHRDYLAKVQTYQGDGNLHAELTDAYGAYNDSFSAPVYGHMPRASIGCAHSTYAFHADCYENSIRHPTRVRWSHPGNPGDYRTNDFIDVGEGQDNDIITAMVSAFGRLFIFKEKSVWVLDGYSAETFSLQKIAQGIGAINKNAVAAVLDGVVFFDRFLGLQKIVPNTQSTWTIKDMWGNLAQAIEDGRMTNPENVTVAASGSRIAVSGIIWKGAPRPNRTWITDEAVGPGWWAYSTGFNLLCAFTDSTGYRTFAGVGPFTNEGGASTTYLNFPAIQKSLSSSVDDKLGATTVTYAGHLTTSWVDGGDPSRKKRFRRFALVFDNMTGSFTVDGYKNWSVDVPPVRTFTVSGTGTPTAAEFGQQISVRSGALGTGYSAAIRITGPTTVHWGLNQVTFRYVPKRVT